MWKRGATAPLGGNRTTEDLGNGEQSASHDPQDRLQSCSNRSHQYDPQGRRTEAACGSRITRYQYNGLGEMTKVTTPDGIEIEYLYDGSGQRIGKKKDGVQERGWLYQSQLRIAAELDGGNAPRATFLHGHSPNVPDGMISESNAEENRLDHRYRLLTDHLGSVGYVVDADTGQIVQELEYDEWGQVLKDSNPGFQPFGYAGGLYDKDTGLVRFGARDYDPREGRWLTKDPIGLAGGYNQFVYAANNPIQYVDPSGLCISEAAADAIAGGVGGGVGGAIGSGGNPLVALASAGIGAAGGYLSSGTGAGGAAISGMAGGFSSVLPKGGGMSGFVGGAIGGAIGGGLGATANGDGGNAAGGLLGGGAGGVISGQMTQIGNNAAPLSMGVLGALGGLFAGLAQDIVKGMLKPYVCDEKCGK